MPLIILFMLILKKELKTYKVRKKKLSFQFNYILQSRNVVRTPINYNCKQDEQEHYNDEENHYT
ncbi:MAG: hypothetical protein BGN96_16455 [Bacteroidales bacterium 45-6]|nr:MAG: hypothetical protein BGN96_16455 [Bacteroidales bacterium 45-6]